MDFIAENQDIILTTRQKMANISYTALVLGDDETKNTADGAIQQLTMILDNVVGLRTEIRDVSAKGRSLTEVLESQMAKAFLLQPMAWWGSGHVPQTLGGGTSLRMGNRLVKDYERYASTLASQHIVAFACFMLNQAAIRATSS
jgi:hypothetical protein